MTIEAVDLAKRRQKLVENMEPMQKALHLLQKEVAELDFKIMQIALENTVGKVFRFECKNNIHYTLPYPAGILTYALEIEIDKKASGQFSLHNETRFTGFCHPESKDADLPALLHDLWHYCPFLLTIVMPERHVIADHLQAIIDDLTELSASTHLADEDYDRITDGVKHAKEATGIAVEGKK